MNDYLKDILFGACIILCVLTISLSFAGMLTAAILVTIYGLVKPNGFASLGLKMPKSWLSNVGQALLYAIIIVLAVQWIITPSIIYFTHEPLDLSVYRPLVGQVQLLLVYLTIGWVIGIVGVLFALIVILNKRKLAVGMLTHGFVNTISMLMIYNGIYKI